MCKICIITNYKNTGNYGALLQAYALNYTLNKMTEKCETLCFDLNGMNNGKITRYYQKICELKIRECTKDIIKDIKKIVIRNKIKRRKSALDNFRYSIPHTKNYKLNNIQEIENEFDVIICGSDQIWRPTFDGKLIAPYWLSCFSNKVIKASYAASMGIISFPDRLLSEVKENLMHFNKISVREEQAKKYLSNLTGREDITTVIDPVFLVDKEQWSALTSDIEINENYILVYMIHGNKKLYKSIEEFATIRGLKIISFPYMSYYYKNIDKNFGDIHNFNATPAEYLSLIKEAKYIFTDSFHATAFSIIFHKNFYVSQANKKAISRIDNLLYKMNLCNCLIPDIGFSPEKYEVDLNIDWNQVDLKINNEKNNGIQYLKSVLDLTKNEGYENVSK